MAYRWLSPKEILELAIAQIERDGSAVCPHDGSAFAGRAHLYSGPRFEVHQDGENILGYVDEVDKNHERAKFLAPIFGAILIDDTKVMHNVLSNVDGTGMDVYGYLKKANTFASEEAAFFAADQITRRVSDRFVGDLHGVVTTSVNAVGRDRVFYDTELPRMGRAGHDIVVNLAKSKEIEIVNDGSIMDIKKLFKIQAVEMAYRVVCVNEMDKLARTAWELSSLAIMCHCVDAQEFYMIDRDQMWEIAAKEIAGARVGAADLIRLDRKLNLGDKLKQRSPEYSGTPTSRLQDKERKLFRFVVEVLAQKALG